MILSTGGTWTLGRDDYGNVNSVTDPDDNTSTAVYDEMNLLESFVNGAGDEVQVTYSPASGNRAAGGMEPAAVITSIRDGRGNATLFEYDEMYRLRRISDELERSHTYTYDGVGRVQRHTLPSGHWVEYSYIYDANGNRETRTARIGGGVTRYEYDSENRLTQVMLPSTDRVQFAYDAMGRLALKVDSSGAIRRYVYDRDEVFAEFDGGGSLVRRYATRDGIDMLFGLISAGTDYIVGTDSLGTVIGFLNDSVPAGLYQYQAFGKIVNEEAGAPQNERTFAGREFESVSGLYHMRARFYDPNTGQFLQRDPLPYNAATGPYVYADNSPTNSRDPYGLDAFNEAVGFGDFMWKRAGEPLLQDSIGRAAEWYVANAVDELAEGTGLMSGMGAGVGSRVGTGIGIAFQFKDIIKIMIADDPVQASIDWYVNEPWNPITEEMMDAFLTMGGTMPRREPRIAPSCTSNAPRDRLIQLHLQSSRTLSQRR